VTAVRHDRHDRHVLVLPDRDSAEEVAAALPERFALDGEPQVVRDALAGEDDAEDAQWLVVVEDPRGGIARTALEELVGPYEGWLELGRGMSAGPGAASGAPGPAVCAALGQPAEQETLGQVVEPFFWIVMPQLLPLPFDLATSVWAFG
jgi:hypothetical protein